MKRYTQLLSVILCLALCLSLMPAAALAEDNSGDFSTVAEEPETLQNENVSETAEDFATAEVIDTGAPAMAATEEDSEEFIGEIIIDEYVPGNVSEDDNDDLFAGYVDQVFYGNNGIMLMSADLAGDHLSGNNLKMYTALKPKIEAIAAGEESSTEFKVKLSSLLNKKYVYTVADLGVDEITTSNVNELIRQALNYDKDCIVNALMTDCPYELYWYAKWKGFTIGVDCAPTYGTSGKLTFKSNGYLYFNFKVAPEYAADATVDPSYSTDRTKTGAAALSAANAQNIVMAAADYSDYDKLAYYRQQICELTSYNSAAAEEAASGTVTSGDPWQLIYVFDNNTDTNVVCEGYAKAFQYLCELTQFDSSEIYSVLASGTIEYNGESDAHMWNVVHMPDGYNYLVDVTNCDDGKIGAPEMLFLRGAVDGSMDIERYTVQLTETESVIYHYDASETTTVIPAQYLELSNRSYFNALDADHGWGAWTEDASTGSHIRTCAVCGLTETCIPGDVNRDYVVNLRDLLILKEWLSGDDVWIYTAGANVNWDDGVNLKDLLTLKQILANA